MEHLNIKVTDGNNEVFFKIKRSTQLKKLMDAFCDRQGKAPSSVRFLFDGTRVNQDDSPRSVSAPFILRRSLGFSYILPLEQRLWQMRCPPWQIVACLAPGLSRVACLVRITNVKYKLDMQDGDTLEVHQEQIGGGGGGCWGSFRDV